MSPPTDYVEGQIPSGGNFEFWLQPGEYTTLIVLKPAGMHFESSVVENLKGAVIVDER